MNDGLWSLVILVGVALFGTIALMLCTRLGNKITDKMIDKVYKEKENSKEDKIDG